MNPFSHSSDTDWVDLFHQSRLTTRRGIDDAIEAFLKQRIDQRALNTLFNIDKTHLVELIISEMDEELALNLLFSVERVTSPFTSSITFKIINKFSQFDLYSPTPLSYAQTHKFKTYRATLNSISAILDGLFSLKPVDSGRHRGPSTGTKAKNSQPGNSALDKAAEKLDLEPYKRLKLRFPKSSSEVEKMIARLLMEIQKAFEFYTSFFRETQVQDALKQAIAANGNTATSEEILSTDATEKEDTERIDRDVATEMSGHRISSLTLDVENIRGFGKWKIFLSPAADTDLRRCSKKERGFFQIVVKKLRDLSRGHFSSSCNHKPVASPQNGIAIWKANVTDNTRLVYHIDLMDEQDGYGGQRVAQVLIVHGLHTHDSFAPVPWEMISRRLGYRGKEWRKSARKRAPGDLLDVYIPMTWGNEALEEVTEPNSNSSSLVPMESEEDIKQMDAFFGQEKFVSFSKRLLHDMLANLDGEFPFEPSSKEREIVDYPYSCYVLGRSGTGKTITILYKMLSIERMFDELSEDLDRPRQVFITHSHVLVKKVKERFAKLYSTLVSASCSPEELKILAQAKDEGQEAEFGMQIDVGDDPSNWPTDLPHRFSELRQKNFPLFISYHHLCTMIEKDIWAAKAKPSGGIQRSAPERRTIDYNYFEKSYWRHFPMQLVKSLDPVTVYSEFMGVISGSEATLSGGSGYLNRDTYLQLAKNQEIAETVYDLFEVFRKRKKGDVDPAERTHAILKAFRDIEPRKFIGQRVDYMFLDEVQDYLLIDALLLRQLCVNPKGMIWAGDTAQTITKGSAFLFTQLTALLHRFEEERLSSARQEAQLPRPKTFFLAVNFRSHSGIVNVARSVVSVIQRFWPQTLDKMEEERGRFPGPKPIFFKRWNDSMDQEGRKDSEKAIPFGAEQCIIVRDEDARKRLKEEMGELGLIFTVGESKGLEFNDVLIYDFFNDCVITERAWQLLISAFDDDQSSRALPTGFDSMCYELKSLYVALTRAKNRLWLVDISDKATPLTNYWLSRPTPVIEQSDEVASLTALGQLSTPEQWKAKGDELFSKKLYYHARQCYIEAGRFFEVQVVDAHLSLESAEYQRTPDSYRKAAREFTACAESVGYNSRRSYYSVAADCFKKAEDYSTAIDHYIRAERFSLAIRLEIKLSNYDAALQTFLRHRTSLPGDDRKSLEYDLRHHFFQKRSFQLLSQLFDGDVDSQFTFFGSTEDKGAQEEHLLYHKRFDQAAHLRIEREDALAGISLFLLGKNFQLAKVVIIRELWLHTSFQDTAAPLVEKLLEYGSSIPPSHISIFEAEELRFMKLLSQTRNDQSAILQYGRAFSQANRSAPALLALDRYLISIRLHHLPLNELQQACAALQIYITLSQKLLAETTHTTVYIQQFGLRQTSSLGSVAVPPISVLFNRLTDAAASKKPIKISARKLEVLSRDFLAERVTTVYNSILQEGYLAQINRPCLVHRRWVMTLCSLYHLSSRPSIEWVSSWLNFTLSLATIRPIRGVSEQLNAPDMRL
ncbi:hypothetical protein CPB83DRAFT_898589 [Crepidotus variabilis]|uniref:UvrD-like helicase C-terminal domain-containing protein n=1 Tax=Crepidotus variabilis TaxID=179855 RepID=A0A9P6E6V7_9AGAR|nr:hypothetical protein CPB83DRAFT_898589 [Crepidotus variabilis]